MVDDERFATREHRVGGDRPDRHLVHERVSPAAVLAQQSRPLAGEGGMYFGRVDLGVVTGRAQDGSCEQRVRADCTAFERWQELMDDHPGSPTTGTTASSSFRRERSTSKSRRRRLPASTSCARNASSVTTRCTASATVHASLTPSTRPASPSVSGTAAAAYATIG